jgi:formylglycine-generating enzyme required for sulfatase activity
MGSENGDLDEKPVHQVTITKPFYMGIYEVTQAQWKAIMEDNPSNFVGDDMPVECVSWEDCQKFLTKLKEKLGEGLTCRLPTEAEWEYACRAGSKTEAFLPDSEWCFEEDAWYSWNSASETHPVGQRKPNAWGLCDMRGNVSEWCSDWKGDYSSSAVTDPTGPPSGHARVLRGGSWNNSAWNCRASSRYMYSPSARSLNFGFRVVCAIAGSR